MPLTRCSECNTSISDQAATCPSCGHPQHPVQVRDVPFVEQSQRESDYRETRLVKQIAAGLILVAFLVVMLQNHPA